MIRHIVKAGLLLLILVSMPSRGLVLPDEADIEAQGWMMSVQVRVVGTDQFVEFCKGSLVDSYWVISAQTCLIDVYDTLSDAVGSAEAEYSVVAEGTGNRYSIEERVLDDAGSFMMLRLKRAALEKPVAVYTGPQSDLIGSGVKIYNNLVSTSLQHGFYSPDGELPSICTVAGEAFSADRSVCYIIANPQTGSDLKMVAGVVIDKPAEEDTTHPLNGLASLQFESPNFVIDYEGSGKFLCYEDFGSAIIAEIDGVATQVGMVVALGGVLGLPMCNSSFYNFHIGFSAAQEFIDSTIAKGVFDRQCPATTSITSESTGLFTTRFHWEPIENVEGYSIVFTPAVGQVPVQSVDVGDITSLDVELELFVTYSLAVQGYNSQCSGPLSEILNVQL